MSPLSPLSSAQPIAPASPKPGLRSLDEALSELIARARPLAGVCELDLFEADGRVLARDVHAQLDVPGFDNSQMDGYALRAQDARPGTVLPVAIRIAAGQPAPALPPDSAARIFTGAALPDGADAVLMQEDCTALAGAPGADGRPDPGGARVQINSSPKRGQWIRARAEDIAAGSTVLRSGALIGPAEIGLAASLGVHRLTVRERLRVALLSTGDELVTPGSVAPADLKPGAIFNSNRYFLAALLRRWGAEVIDLGLVADTRDATVHALLAASEAAHLVVSTGGVSVGEEDHVKPAVQALGELSVWQISMKPGKPFAFGRVQESHFVGLPGNPVSSFVTALLLVRPLVRALQGLPQQALEYEAAIALDAGPKPDKRREFLRGRMEPGENGRMGVRLFPNQNSSVLTSMHWADVLVDNPSMTQITQGAEVQCVRLAALMGMSITPRNLRHAND